MLPRFAAAIRTLSLVLRQEGERAVLEHRFAPPRLWRFDMALPDRKIALEVEGGVWTRGRHVRPQGYLRDIEKYNAAQLSGWIVLRCVPDEVLTKGYSLLEAAIRRREEDGEEGNWIERGREKA